MVLPLLPIIGGIGAGISAGAGSESTTDSSMVSDTTGSSEINRTEFNPKLMKALQGLFNKNNLKRNFQKTNKALKGSLNEVRGEADFDVESFVNGIMAKADNTIGNQLDESKNLLESDIGGTSATNSMAALLEGRMATDAASQRAGIMSQATAEGTKIRNDQLSGQVANTIGLTGQMNKTFTDFLTLLRGAKTNQTQKSSEHTEGTSTSTTSTPFNPMEAIGGFLGSFKAPT